MAACLTKLVDSRTTTHIYQYKYIACDVTKYELIHITHGPKRETSPLQRHVPAYMIGTYDSDTKLSYRTSLSAELPFRGTGAYIYVYIRIANMVVVSGAYGSARSHILNNFLSDMNNVPPEPVQVMDLMSTMNVGVCGMCVGVCFISHTVRSLNDGSWEFREGNRINIRRNAG